MQDNKLMQRIMILKPEGEDRTMVLVEVIFQW